MTRESEGLSASVTQAFEPTCVRVPIGNILPIKTLRKAVTASRKYRQIAASIREVGLVERLVVARNPETADLYLLLDGHMRIAILKDLGVTDVECLVSTDDEAFTYNKRISRLAAVQEHKMIVKAIERGVSDEKIARALDLDISSIRRKVRLLDGICDEAAAMLKEKPCPMGVFEILKKMLPLRQIDAAETMINSNNYSISYASAILMGTPQAQLVQPNKPKTRKNVTPEVIARLERELARMQEGIASIHDDYAKNNLHLTVVKGYIRKLLDNGRVLAYLLQNRPEFVPEFQSISELTSTIPSE